MLYQYALHSIPHCILNNMYYTIVPIRLVDNEQYTRWTEKSKIPQ